MPLSGAIELQSIPESLHQKQNATLLTGILRGIEKESLRVGQDGALSKKGHPRALGSALTHPQITTDFSEALLEFITPPSHSIDTLFSQLNAIQRYTYQHIGEEMLWSSSMPCAVGGDADIPVAQYGTSNRAKMKTIYRVGLGHRYGRVMQTVAGIHYNFSFPRSFWSQLHQEENSIEELPDFTTRRYFDLIRNFRRNYWLLIYLFGASPAVCRSFVKGRPHQLEVFNNDEHTLHLPYATSLRMGDLGYQSKAQEELFVCYNGKNTYLNTLINAIRQPYAPYEGIGILNGEGDYKQLNTSLLQIENEFYSAIRPKRGARPGETALNALCHRGVEYIEVRCLDLDPFEPLGISGSQARFIDTFLLYCVLQDSPTCDMGEYAEILENQKLVVNEGRRPDLQLNNYQGDKVSLKNWAHALLDTLKPLAELMDHSHGGGKLYTEALEAQILKVNDPDVTPSARILNAMRSENLSYHQWALRQSLTQRASQIEPPLSESITRRFDDMAEESLTLQAQEESQIQEPFANYLAAYYQQYTRCCDKRI